MWTQQENKQINSQKVVLSSPRLIYCPIYSWERLWCSNNTLKRESITGWVIARLFSRLYLQIESHNCISAFAVHRFASCQGWTLTWRVSCHLFYLVGAPKRPDTKKFEVQVGMITLSSSQAWDPIISGTKITNIDLITICL